MEDELYYFVARNSTQEYNDIPWQRNRQQEKYIKIGLNRELIVYEIQSRFEPHYEGNEQIQDQLRKNFYTGFSDIDIFRSQCFKLLSLTCQKQQQCQVSWWPQ